MKKIFLAGSSAVMLLASCEVEMVEGRSYHHQRGWEHNHYPQHHEIYNHGYHHNAHGDEIIIEHRR